MFSRPNTLIVTFRLLTVFPMLRSICTLRSLAVHLVNDQVMHRRHGGGYGCRHDRCLPSRSEGLDLRFESLDAGLLLPE